MMLAMLGMFGILMMMAPPGFQVAAEPNTWTLLTGAAPWSARDRAAATVLKGRVFLAGGYDYHEHLNDVWSSEDGITWTQVSNDASWTARSGHSMVTFNKNMWILAGENSPIGKSIYFNDVWASPDGKQWEQLTGNAPWCKRTSAAAATFDSKVFVLGGVSESNTYLNDVWSSADGREWTELVTAAPWSPRWGLGAAVLRNQLVIMGGNIDFGPGETNDVWSTLDGRAWQRGSDAPWAARADFGLVATEDQIYLAGGTSYKKFNDIWASNGTTWTEILADAPWGPRSGLCSAILPTKVLGIFGGNGRYVQEPWCGHGCALMTKVRSNGSRMLRQPKELGCGNYFG
ncbi:unnamed protein product [Durusdinium trenchii]|uniref:Uncharacterized protein n=2 Tax=Durusdinium trenchii TaxID=1381693 RepID=A0ABP0RM87_9DINO